MRPAARGAATGRTAPGASWRPTLPLDAVHDLERLAAMHLTNAARLHSVTLPARRAPAAAWHEAALASLPRVVRVGDLVVEVEWFVSRGVVCARRQVAPGHVAAVGWWMTAAAGGARA